MKLSLHNAETFGHFIDFNQISDCPELLKLPSLAFTVRKVTGEPSSLVMAQAGTISRNKYRLSQGKQLSRAKPSSRSHFSSL